MLVSVGQCWSVLVSVVRQGVLTCQLSPVMPTVSLPSDKQLVLSVVFHTADSGLRLRLEVRLTATDRRSHGLRNPSLATAWLTRVCGHHVYVMMGYYTHTHSSSSTAALIMEALCAACCESFISGQPRHYDTRAQLLSQKWIFFLLNICRRLFATFLFVLLLGFFIVLSSYIYIYIYLYIYIYMYMYMYMYVCVCVCVCVCINIYMCVCIYIYICVCVCVCVCVCLCLYLWM